METKLNKLLQKKSLVTARHAELKHLITHSRKLRLQTDLSHDKLVDSLQDYRHRIENMLMEATDVLEEREKTLRAKESLEARNAEEQMNMTRDYENMVLIKASDEFFLCFLSPFTTFMLHHLLLVLFFSPLFNVILLVFSSLFICSTQNDVSVITRLGFVGPIYQGAEQCARVYALSRTQRRLQYNHGKKHSKWQR